MLIRTIASWCKGTIKGQIFDVDKKVGLRGVVDYRDGALLASAFATDLLTNISQLLSVQASSNLSDIMSGDESTQSDVFQALLGNSASKTSDTLSKLLIERLKDVQPTIEVSATNQHGDPRSAYLVVRNQSEIAWDLY